MSKPDETDVQPAQARLTWPGAVVLVMICIPVLAPGGCALFFIGLSEPPFGPLMIFLWLASFIISIGGVVLIAYAALRSK